MKKVILFLLGSILAFANSLQELPYNLSSEVKEVLLKEFSISLGVSSAFNYRLKKGWNKLKSTHNGINIVKTFNDASKIRYVLTYYKTGKLWAVYAPEETFSDMLFLKYLEPDIIFFVLAKEDGEVSVKSNIINDSCRVFLENTKKYASVLDSGISRSYTTSKDGIMSLQSRYFSHHDRGIYNDTRTLLIYPKLHSDKQRKLKYGPANPKVAIKFPKAYESKRFYLYDFKQQKCFEGIFPSIKIPPYPVLKELK